MRLGLRFTRKLLAGELPALTDEPDLREGQVIEQRASMVWIVVGRRVKVNRWSYSITDRRPRLLQRDSARGRDH